MTPQTREELTEEFLCWIGVELSDTVTAKWWLDKFDQLLIEKQDRIHDLKIDACPPSMRYERDAVNVVVDEAINILKE